MPCKEVLARMGKRATGALLLGPSLLLLTAFLVLPILFTVWVSLHSWDMLTPIGSMPWAAGANVQQLLTDPVFLAALRNTLLYAVGTAAIVIPLAVGLGLLLGPSRLRGAGTVRALLFLPYVIPNVAVAIVWGYILAPIYGPANALLQTLGIPAQAWLGAPREALASILLLNVWQTLGYYTVIVIAGLAEIPTDVHEAARIDGARWWQATWHVTLPLLRRALGFLIVILSINTLQVFAPVYILTQGGPINSTQTIVYHMWVTAFSYLQMGPASMMALVLLIVVLIVTYFELRMLGTVRRQRPEGG